MKRLLFTIISLSLFLFVVTGCTKDKEIIKISKSGSSDIKTIDSKSTVDEIKSILAYIKYSKNDLDLDLNNPDYKLWSENNNSDKRDIDLKLWYNPSSVEFIILKPSTNEIGTLAGIESDKFTTILSGIK